MGTIRIAHFGCSHFDIERRLDDNVRVHDAMIEQAADAGVDLWLAGADWGPHKIRRSNAVERAAMREFVIDACKIAPMYSVLGNHDGPHASDLLGMEDLETVYPFRIADRAQTYYGSTESDVSYAVVAMPWIEKGNPAASLPVGFDMQQADEHAKGLGRQLLDLLGAEVRRNLADGAVPLFLSHVHIGGSVLSNGYQLIGRGIEFSPADIDSLGCAYAALNHFHNRQPVGRTGWYSGSVNRTNLGEVEAKGWNLATVTDGKLVDVEFKRLPVRRIVQVELDVAMGSAVVDDGTGTAPVVTDLESLPDALDEGDMVQVKASVGADYQGTVDRAQIERLVSDCGADDVEVQIHTEVQFTTREGAEQIVRADGLESKLRAFAAHDKPDADTDEIDDLVSKLRELEVAA